MHECLLLLSSKLAVLSYSLAELVRKSGFLAQVSGVGGKKTKQTRLKVLLLCSLFSPVQPDIVLRERGLAALSSQRRCSFQAGRLLEPPQLPFAGALCPALLSIFFLIK